MSSVPLEHAQVCAECGQPLLGNAPFCPHCGASVLSSKQRHQVDEYVQSRVARELDARLTDETRLTRSLADQVESVVWTRIWRYGALVALLIAVAGAFGYSSFRDVTNSVKEQLQPQIDAAKKSAGDLQHDVNGLSLKVSATKSQLDAISGQADQQKKRLDSQSGEATQKINGLQTTLDRMNKLAGDYEKRANDSLNRITVQASRTVALSNDVAVDTVYGGLDAQDVAEIYNVTVNKKMKHPNDVWVNVEVSNWAMTRHLISRRDLKELVNELTSAGFTPFLGVPMMGGATGYYFNALGSTDQYSSNVIYFDPAFKAKADQLTVITSKYAKLASGSPVLQKPDITSQALDKERLRRFLDLSGIDAQIYISGGPVQ